MENKKAKYRIFRILLSIIIFMLGLFFNTISFELFLLAYIIIGYDILFNSIRKMFKGNFLDENFLMSVATLGAMALGEYSEACAVMILYQIGEAFVKKATDNSKKAVESLAKLRQPYANLVKNDNTTEKVSLEEVFVGDVILVKPGEKIPVDGTIIKGNGLVDTKYITGESIPKKVDINDEVYSGYINLNSPIELRVKKGYKDSTVSKIIDLVEKASNRKSNPERFITRFAKRYTPIVVFLSVLILIVPVLIMGVDYFEVWLYRALTFLTLSCPCALVISIPLAFFTAIGGASKKGILIKGSNYLEDLSKVDKMIFDKTGTLTEGNFKVQKIYPEDIKTFDLLKYAAYAETYSNHPIGVSIKKFYGKEIDEGKIGTVEEISGKGIYANVFGKDVLIRKYKTFKR